jgi:hypothetical protein
LSPANGTRLHDFGIVDLWKALNLVEADLRKVNFNIAGARTISLSPINSLVLETVLQPRLTLIDPLDFEPSLDLPVRAFGVRTGLRRFALLVVWNTSRNRVRCFYRRYNQALPSALIEGGFPKIKKAGDLTDCAEGRDHTRTIAVPVVPSDLMFPSPDRGLEGAGGTVSVEVGYQELNCISRGDFKASPILLIRPWQLTWTVITKDGVRHRLDGGQDIVIDVGVRVESPGIVINNPLLADSRRSRVTFRLKGPDRAVCRVVTERGKDGSFVFEIEFVDSDGQSFVARREVKFTGKKTRSVGYGLLSKLLDQLHRGVQDPSRWPDLGGTLPGAGDIGPKPPDPRDDLPGGGRPGVGDPAGPEFPNPNSGDGSPSPRRRYFARAAGAGGMGEREAGSEKRMTKEDLLFDTLQTFRELPDALYNQPFVKGYMVNVIKLLGSLPEPSSDGEEDEEQPPSKPDKKPARKQQ